MILSHKHKFIYIKTRKTASSSIEALLSRHCGPDDVITPTSDRLMTGERSPAQNYRLDHPLVPKQPLLRRLLGRPERLYHPTIGFYEHIPAWRIKAYVGDDIWDSYYKFTFERNPWDKQISWYRYKTKSRKQRPSFESFMRDKKKALVDNYPLYALDGEIAVDFVGRYETLNEHLAQVLETIGLESKEPLPQLNVFGDGGDYRSQYTNTTRRLVEDWYEPEIKAFGYEF
jgi:hypothetical protein